MFFFFFKQKTAYEISVRDWSSDVCSSDLPQRLPRHLERRQIELQLWQGADIGEGYRGRGGDLDRHRSGRRQGEEVDLRPVPSPTAVPRRPWETLQHLPCVDNEDCDDEPVHRQGNRGAPLQPSPAERQAQCGESRSLGGGRSRMRGHDDRYPKTQK